MILQSRFVENFKFSCGGGGGGSGAVEQNQANQQLLTQQGLQQLNSIFNGGTYGTNPASSWTPGTQYYYANGQPVPTTAQPLDVQSLVNQGGAFTGTGTSTGFGPDFYQKAGQAYTNYATPQLNQQYRQAQGSLRNSLSDRGLLGGSAATSQSNSLANALGQGRQQIANSALGQEQGLQQQVGQSQNALTQQLIASQNPAAVSLNALAQAQQFSAPSPLPAVGSFFNNWLNQNIAQNIGQSGGGLSASSLYSILNPFRSSTSAGGAPASYTVP